MGRAARRDGNEGELLEAAKRIGLRVFRTSELGDAIVQYGGLTELWEIKNGPQAKLTPAQCRMRQAGLTARLVRTVEDVMEAKRVMMANLGAINQVRAWSLRNGDTNEAKHADSRVT